MPQRKKPIRFAFYGRTSSDQQDVENSIAGQRSAAEEFVRRLGGIIVTEYIDEGKSGRVADRPGFQEMIKDGTSPKPDYDAIVSWKLNRFARSVKDTLHYWDLLEDHGIRVYSVMESFMDDPTGKLMRTVIAAVDQFFSDSMGTDIRRGMKEAVERGFWIGYPAPIGYKVVKIPHGEPDGNGNQRTKQKLELDPPQDALVRYIFDLALQDLTVLDIARKVTDEGYLTKAGKKFTKTKIHTILTNRTYTGFIFWNFDPETGEPEARSREQAHPAIISEEEFNKVQQKLKSRAPNVRHPRSVANEHLFNDLGKCSQCEAKMAIRGGKNNAYHYWVCKTKDHFGKDACEQPSYSTEKNDPIIMGAILEDILTEENLRELIATVRDTAGPTTRNQERQLENIDHQIKLLNERQDRYVEAIGKPNSLIDKLNAQIDGLEAQIKEQQALKAQVQAQMGDEATIIQEPDRILAYAEDVRTYLQSAQVKSVNEVCRQFIKTIWFEPEFAEIEYSIPIPDGTPDPAVKTRRVALQTRVPRTVPDGPPRPVLMPSMTRRNAITATSEVQRASLRRNPIAGSLARPNSRPAFTLPSLGLKPARFSDTLARVSQAEALGNSKDNRNEHRT